MTTPEGSVNYNATPTHTTQKLYSREELNILVAEQLQLCIEPICQQIGEVIEGLMHRVLAVESATNALISEMKGNQGRYQRVIQ